MSTHALATTGTGATTAATKTKIGSTLTLPSGGPWLIFGLWAQVAKVTAAANEGTGGQLIIDSLTGDLVPDPAPGKYPLTGSCVVQGANNSISALPLNIWPVNWQASGKAQIDLSYLNQLAITTGSAVAAGIIFGDKIPEKKPFPFCDSVYSAFASALESSIGTITLAEKATRIVGIMGVLAKGDAPTAGQAVLGTFRLSSSDIMLPPAQYPFAYCYDACTGTPVGQSAMPMAQFISVDIEVEGGARIDCFATTTQSVTGNADVQIYIAYE